MSTNQLVSDIEGELRGMAGELTEIQEGECLFCYVYRMLEFGCSGLRWSSRYRDERAPRATALERRLGQMGGYCDCEIFMNAYEPAAEHWIRSEPDDNSIYEDEPEYPEQMPPCRGTRKSSTQACRLWVRRHRFG